MTTERLLVRGLTMFEGSPTPTIEQIREWDDMGGCEATDGCWVEFDGECEHGCKSWLIILGLI